MLKTLPRKKVVIEFDLDLYDRGYPLEEVMKDFEHDITTLKEDISLYYFAGKVNVTKVQISEETYAM